ncbi:hypothetical protein CH375_07645 [Leptospira ellisii]|uniref:Uncharacterized protein n=1 Tax=Leptospira ellisii TaxID=2023197 RepID=A0A2N0BAS9_9LEPT|nr:hypothetical protein CH379_06790 [Leptospira ellisii]PKA05006.1 hypothetical protein CH375_07645 [Leptospira ellisii]
MIRPDSLFSEYVFSTAEFGQFPLKIRTGRCGTFLSNELNSERAYSRRSNNRCQSQFDRKD